jgi:hypothetical protein
VFDSAATLTLACQEDQESPIISGTRRLIISFFSIFPREGFVKTGPTMPVNRSVNVRRMGGESAFYHLD